MALAKMTFCPPDGLSDNEHYPTTPESEEQARAQIQSVSNQLRDYINDTLLYALENKTAGQSGAELIGSAVIDSVTGETVHAQIADIKAQIDSIVAGTVADGTITEQKLASGAVTQSKITTGAVDTDQILGGAVTAAKIGTGAVNGEKIIDGAVTSAKIGAGAVTETRIGTGAVTAAKISTGAVSKSKLGADALVWTPILQSDEITGGGSLTISSQAGKSEMMIQLRGGDGNSVYAMCIAPLDAQGRTQPVTHMMHSYYLNDFSIDYRMITVNTTAVGYTAARVESLGGTTSLKRIYVFVR